ncbi:MAG: aspartate kinase [Candidatus Xenobia bacterium]
MEDICVLKFGGTSVSTEERREMVVQRVREFVAQGKRAVVVVSAMGRQGDPYATDTLIGLLRGAGGELNKRGLDLMMSCGEIIAAAIMAQLFTARGLSAVPLTGAQAGIVTEAAPGKARITRIDAGRLLRELEDNPVAVVAGFQGITSPIAGWGDVTTLGRGGSDTTAVALAAALKLPDCYIYTDVDGIYTCDPRLVAEARRVPELSYEEALELCRSGAKVVHARAVELAFTYGLKVFVGHYAQSGGGSWIMKGEDMEISNRVSGVTVQPGLCLITAADVPNVAGVAEAFVKPLIDARIEFKLLQSGSVIDRAMMSYEVSPADLPRALELLSASAAKFPRVQISSKPGLGRITVVGTGIGHPEYLWRVLDTLKQIGANNYQIENFEHRISSYIDEKDLAAAAKALHEAFELSLAPTATP